MLLGADWPTSILNLQVSSTFIWSLGVGPRHQAELYIMLVQLTEGLCCLSTGRRMLIQYWAPYADSAWASRAVSVLGALS